MSCGPVFSVWAVASACLWSPLPRGPGHQAGGRVLRHWWIQKAISGLRPPHGWGLGLGWGVMLGAVCIHGPGSPGTDGSRGAPRPGLSGPALFIHIDGTIIWLHKFLACSYESVGSLVWRESHHRGWAITLAFLPLTGLSNGFHEVLCWLF